MRPRFFVSLLSSFGLFLASSCGGTSSSSPESAGSAGVGVAGAAVAAAGKGAGGSDSAGSGGAGGGSAGTVFDPCKGVPPPQYACVPVEQAWEWIRDPGAAGPLPDPSAGGEGGNGGAGGGATEGGATGVQFPAGTCPSIQSIAEHLGPGANTTGFGLGAFRDGECCYNWGVACG